MTFWAAMISPTLRPIWRGHQRQQRPLFPPLARILPPRRVRHAASGQRDLATLLAADLAASLRDAKAMVLGPYPSEAEALEAMGLEAPEAAVLDINLGDGGPRFDLARQLRRRGIPFVFLTGYSSEVIPDDLSDVPLIEKPTDFHSLIDLLATF